MPIVNVPEADEPIEVPADAIEVQDDEDVVLKTQAELDSTIQSRLNRKERNLRSELKTDDEFFREAAKERGYEFNEDGELKGSTSDDELKQLRKEKAQLEQKAQQVEELQEQIESARNTKLENELLKVADGLQEGAEDDLLRIARERMEYDEDEGRHVLMGEDAPKVTPDGSYAGPVELVDELRDDKPYLFKDTEVSNGPGTQPDSTGGDGKRTWTRDEWEQAASRTHEMDDDTFEDWDTAEEEGRIQD